MNIIHNKYAQMTMLIFLGILLPFFILIQQNVLFGDDDVLLLVSLFYDVARSF